MRILLSIVFLCLCISTQAQKKNEIQIGLPSVYFFDDKPYSFNSFVIKVPLPTHISYTRLLSDSKGLSFSLNYFWLDYDISHKIDEVWNREYVKISMEYYQEKKINRFSLRGRTGIGYRMGSEIFLSSFGYTDEGVIWEIIGDRNPYNHLCLMVGLQTRYRLLNSLSIIAQINLSRYLSKHSPNELHNVFGLSYGF